MARRSSNQAETRPEPEVFAISGARKSVSEDVTGRQRRYLISMGVRTACFVLAVIVSGPLRWVFLVGAVFLPYLSVVFANAGREPGQTPPTTIVMDNRPALGPGPGRSATTDSTSSTGSTDSTSSSNRPGPARAGRREHDDAA